MVTSMPVSGQQAPSVPLQTGTMPATTTAQNGFDINSIMNMLIMVMVVVMMMKVMRGATEKI